MSYGMEIPERLFDDLTPEEAGNIMTILALTSRQISPDAKQALMLILEWVADIAKERRRLLEEIDIISDSLIADWDEIGD